MEHKHNTIHEIRSNLLSNPADKLTDEQTDKQTGKQTDPVTWSSYITTSAEVHVITVTSWSEETVTMVWDGINDNNYDTSAELVMTTMMMMMNEDTLIPDPQTASRIISSWLISTVDMTR